MKAKTLNSVERISKIKSEITGGEHQFIVATHIDKKHIHNHIEFNSTALDCSHKFNNIKNSFIPLRKANDRVLPTASTFDEFLEAMRREGYEVVQSSKLLKFRAQGQERFTRSKTLGADYSLEALRDRVGKAKQPRHKKKIRLEKDTRINLLMNIQARLQGRGPGMERWM